MFRQPPYNLPYLTRLSDEDIMALLQSCAFSGNWYIVLGLLREANDLFRTRARTDIVRGAAYLKAADSMALQSRDLSICTQGELEGLPSIGSSIATKIRDIVVTRHH
jgi:hypothetical protein